MRFLRAALAAVALVATIFGVPALLVALVGSPWPDGGWTSVKLVTDSTVLGLLAAAGWLVWAQLVLCLVTEGIAELQGVSLPAVGPGFQRRFARTLIRAVFLVGATGSIAAIAWHPLQADAVAPSASSTPRVVAVPPSAHETERPGPKASVAAAVHVVEPGDTLWGIAERRLGDGLQWRSIAEMNQGRVMTDGSTFTAAGEIRPGWHLHLPGQKEDLAPTVTVAPGDSLSAIAEHELGEVDRWRALYRANKDQIGPDPDLIQVGEHLRLPNAQKSISLNETLDQPAASYGEDAEAPLLAEDVDAPPPHGERTSTLFEPAPAPESAPAGSSPMSEDRTTSDDEVPITAVTPWRAALATGSCLAVGLLGLLVANRRRQLEARRPGRVVRPTPEELRPVERAIHEVGRDKESDVAFIDRGLRLLALLLRQQREPLPELGAAVLSSEGLTLRMIGLPAAPPDPWTQVDDDTWFLARDTEMPVAVSEQPPPYPALVSTGLDQAGCLWLLDLEAHGGAGIDVPAGLLVHWVSELAANPWGTSIELLVADPELAPLADLNPERVTLLDAELANRRAAALRGDAEGRFASLLELRRDGVVEDATGPVVIMGAIHDSSDVAGRGRDRVVVLAKGSRDLLAKDSGGWSIVDWDVPIEPFELDTATFRAVSRLLGHTEDLADAPAAAPWRHPSADGGAPQADGELRPNDSWDEKSLLPAPSRAYVAANEGITYQDVARLAPAVAPAERLETLALDPELDVDLADWADPSCQRPKVKVLGPIDVSAVAGSRDGIRNMGSTVEFIVYLAFSERGVTKDRAAEDLGWSGATVQNRARDARRLMGFRRDGTDWLPDAARSESARRRGVPTYQLHNEVLLDADLLRRLQARAHATGAEGYADVAAALNLVDGEPFDQLRKGGFGWLLEGDRVDLQLAATVDDLRLIRRLRASA